MRKCLAFMCVQWRYVHVGVFGGNEKVPEAHIGGEVLIGVTVVGRRENRNHLRAHTQSKNKRRERWMAKDKC